MKVRLSVVLLFAAAVLLSACFFACSKNSAGGDVDEDDGTAPATIVDLAVEAFCDTSVTLTWTASGDDSASGTASSYDLRLSKVYIHWGNFDSAVQVSGTPAPKPSGETEHFEISGLETDSTYYFALKVSDENGNYEGVSNCVSATCFNDYVVTFPDVGLQAAVRDRINKPSGDILKSDLAGMSDLLADDRSIASLTGLRHCTDLAILNIINNSVSDLSPLSQLDKLEQLHAGQNDITNVAPLANLTALTWLRLNDNQIGDISPLAGLIALTSLDLEYNRIVTVSSLQGLIELAQLNLSYNHVKDIAPLINNAGLGSGDHINLILNPLEHESIMTCIPALRSRGATVHWMDNVTPSGDIVDLEVTAVTSNSVTLTWTAPGEDYYSGTAYLYEIRYSGVRSDLESWSGGVVVSSVPHPDTAGTIQTKVVTGLTEDSTYYFAVRTQDNSENWSGVSNIAWGRPYSDAAVIFTDPTLESVMRTALGIPSGDINRSDLLTLDTLFADGWGISDLTGLEYCVNLTHLHLIDNNLTSIEQLAELNGLYDLNLQGNNVSDISPLASLTGLGVLQITGNTVGDLSDLAGLTNVWFLAASITAIDDLGPLSSMTNLQYLFVTNNDISDLSSLSSCPLFSVLYADNNAVSSLTPLSGLTNVSFLSLKHNDIEDISPLVSNSGLGEGDQVALEDNPLSTESINTHIPALQARGVTVSY